MPNFSNSERRHTSLIDMINMLLINVLAAVATGGAVVVSQYIGRKDKDQASFAASQLITVTAVISAGIMLLVLLFNKPMLRAQFGRIDDDVMEVALSLNKKNDIFIRFPEIFRWDGA